MTSPYRTPAPPPRPNPKPGPRPPWLAFVWFALLVIAAHVLGVSTDWDGDAEWVFAFAVDIAVGIAVSIKAGTAIIDWSMARERERNR